MDEDDEYTIEALPAVEMQAIDAVILVLDAAAAVARVPGRFLDDLGELLCRHANWKVERKRFAREASSAIESIASGE